jgi:hypothetical protein
LTQPGKNKIKRTGSLCNIGKWTAPITKSSDESVGSMSLIARSRMQTFIFENEIILVEILKSSLYFYSQKMI